MQTRGACMDCVAPVLHPPCTSLGHSQQSAETRSKGAACRRSRDAGQGQAVQRQLRVWEALLEVRILLQKPLRSATACPRPGWRSTRRWCVSAARLMWLLHVLQHA